MKSITLVIGFCLGVAVTSFVSLSWWGALFFVLLACALAGLFIHTKSRPYLLGALVFCAVSIGVVRTELQRSVLPESFVTHLGSERTYEGKIVADPDVRETSARLTLLVTEGDDQTKILAVTPLFPEARYGEVVEVTGTLVRPEPFATDNGRTFRYDLFLAKDGIHALLERASLEIVAPRSGVIDQIRGFFSDLKFAGIDSLAVALPEPQASLASGLVLGGKQGLGTTLLDDFIVAGLIHIVVLSGYNVMIVAEAILRLFSLFAKRFAAIAAGIVITGFVLVAGAGAASLRAGIMAGVALFGRATGRTYDAFRALMAAGVFMLLLNPLLLIHDPGFQLSFIATLGLIFGAPITERWVMWVRPTFLREVVASTIAAQISVLPLLLYQNGLFSLISLPANVLVLPLVPLAMAFSAGAGLAGFLAPALAPIVALPAYAFLSIIISAVEVAAHLPLAAVTIPAFPFVFVGIGYALLTWFVVNEAKRAT